MVEWSPQQAQALDAVGAWHKAAKDGGPQVFYLAGYAGTGKTTLAKHMADSIDGDVCFAAFTGKAALMMRSKGCSGASTIHSLIYAAEEDEDGIIRYKLNSDSALDDAALAVIDECSMVDEKLGRDLLSFGKPVLVIGDPAQLPPVSGTGFFTSREPDMLLTEVHRQARDNPIIRLSMDISSGLPLSRGTYGETRIIPRSQLTKNEVLAADQVIVGRNATRQNINAKIRRYRYGDEVEPNVPVDGEKLICLRNKHSMGLLNGGMWSVGSIDRVANGIIQMAVDPLDDAGNGKSQLVNTPTLFFEGREQELSNEERRYVEEFTFGHAITCHKSQGSQWDHVVIFDKSYIFRADAQRWRYTAITRAAKRMTLVM